MRVAHNKLVRDRIPEIIALNWHSAVTHILDDDCYRDALLAKLLEEAKEASEASAEDLPAELADVLEVLQALATTLGMTWGQVFMLAAEKRTQCGGFHDRIFLEYVEEHE